MRRVARGRPTVRGSFGSPLCFACCGSGSSGAVAHTIDIDPRAVSHAIRYHDADDNECRLADAGRDPFPRRSYDAIVWVGALGHCSPEDTGTMLAKIAAALKPDGIFIGSESLGRKGHDHLQCLAALDEWGELLSPYLRHVDIREGANPMAISSLRG
jgi:SAM-dependent methyltransferase